MFCRESRLDNSILDNDDDGETAAGGRLAHLLQILVRDRTSPSAGPFV